MTLNGVVALILS